MKLRRFVVWLFLAVTVLTAVEGSILLKKSLLQPLKPAPCFTCRTEDRPAAYSLISYLARVKDMVVRGLNALVANTKSSKLK